MKTRAKKNNTQRTSVFNQFLFPAQCIHCNQPSVCSCSSYVSHSPPVSLSQRMSFTQRVPLYHRSQEVHNRYELRAVVVSAAETLYPRLVRAPIDDDEKRCRLRRLLCECICRVRTICIYECGRIVIKLTSPWITYAHERHDDDPTVASYMQRTGSPSNDIFLFTPDPSRAELDPFVRYHERRMAAKRRRLELMSYEQLQALRGAGPQIPAWTAQRRARHGSPVIRNGGGVWRNFRNGDQVLFIPTFASDEDIRVVPYGHAADGNEDVDGENRSWISFTDRYCESGSEAETDKGGLIASAFDDPF